MKMFSKRRRVIGTALLSTICVAGVSNVAVGGADENKNIVIAVASPPVVANGIMAGEPTEIITVLTSLEAANNQAMDPANIGHFIPSGGWMEVELSGTFERNGVDNDKGFVAIGSNANFVLVTGLPQMPITAPAGDGVQHGNYTIMDDGNYMITVKPNGGNGDKGLEQKRAQEIGLKVVHIRPRPGGNVGPFTNGPAGTLGTVDIRIFDKEGKLKESGSGSVTFPHEMGRRIGPTNVGLATGGQGRPTTVTAELVESVNYQRVAPGTELVNTVKGITFSDGAPYAPRFLMFEKQSMQPDSFIPFKGIANVGYVVKADKPSMADLVEDSNGNGIPDADDNKIGMITITSPGKEDDEVPGMILDSATLTTSGDGTAGPNGSVLNVPVKIGTEEGTYRISVSLNGGNTAVTAIIVED